MADVKVIPFVFVAILLTYAGSGDALSCYSCNSLNDSRCGLEFGYSANDAAEIVEECINDPNVACRKTESLRVIAGAIVSRSCWNPTNSSRGLPDLTCTEIGLDDLSCYCVTDFCNGQLSRHGNIITVLAHLIVSAIIVVM